jgi:hypothetical protein
MIGLTTLEFDPHPCVDWRHDVDTHRRPAWSGQGHARFSPRGRRQAKHIGNAHLQPSPLQWISVIDDRALIFTVKFFHH